MEALTYRVWGHLVLVCLTLIEGSSSTVGQMRRKAVSFVEVVKANRYLVTNVRTQETRRSWGRRGLRLVDAAGIGK